VDDIPSDAQPGLFVRRVNGKTLSEDEMITHYSNLAARYGGKLNARYITGLVLMVDGQEYTAEIPDDDLTITCEPNPNRQHRGNPLDVVTICPANGKYFNDCSLDELSVLAGSFDEKCIRFLQESKIIPEKSCGAVVYSIIDGHTEYFLVEETSGFYSFPKGHIEIGESEEQTATREILEETGLDLKLISGFRKVSEYVPAERPTIKRQIVYFLAENKNQEPRIVRPQEVKTIKRLKLEDALHLLEYEDPRRILLEADEFING
jgi:8-oxo-dGTP pyrophosphatase MutT (NUDIX family)